MLGGVELSGLDRSSTCAGEGGRFCPLAGPKSTAAGGGEEEDLLCLCPAASSAPGGMICIYMFPAAVAPFSPDLFMCLVYPEVGEIQDVFGSDTAEDRRPPLAFAWEIKEGDVSLAASGLVIWI